MIESLSCPLFRNQAERVESALPMILRIVKETGTEFQKQDPLPICENYYKWIKGKTIRKNLTGKKE